MLNRNGLKTGHGNRWTREGVTALRSHHRIPVHRPAADGCEQWLNLSKAAALVGVALRTLRVAAEKGQIEAAHPLPDVPSIFSRAELEGPVAKDLNLRARRSAQRPTAPDPAQQNLFPSTA